MTSISVSGSGQREYHLHAGSGQYTSVGLQPKAGDDVQASFNSVGKIEFAVSPSCLRIERRVKPDADPSDDGYLVVVVESEHATSITAIMRNKETNGLTPAISLRLQDELEPQFLDGLEVAESTTGADLFPGITP